MNDMLCTLDQVYRANSRHIFARLVKSLGDFDIAEDALQDAVFEAAKQWPSDGVPNNPAGWLYKVAKFRGIDSIRRKQRLAALTEQEEQSVDEHLDVGDELLRLIFMCCHPAISPDTQVALTLREVCELTTEEIAKAFLLPVPTVAQRIVRAKSKIRIAGIPFEIPTKEDLPDRLQPALKTIYLVFNEGYSSSSGEHLMRPELMSLAVHLARQLLELMPEPEVQGLLALMLIHQARSYSRTTPEGEIVLLEDQDRSLWDHVSIRIAGNLVSDAILSRRYGVYTVQAAIAAVHAESPSFEETDWNEIVGLYDVLVNIESSQVAELNRAVAIAMRDGVPAGLVLIDNLLSSRGLSDYHLAYVARAELYRRHGDIAKATADYLTAIDLTHQEPERRFIRKCLQKI